MFDFSKLHDLPLIRKGQKSRKNSFPLSFPPTKAGQKKTSWNLRGQSEECCIYEANFVDASLRNIRTKI